MISNEDIKNIENFAKSAIQGVDDLQKTFRTMKSKLNPEEAFKIDEALIKSGAEKQMDELRKVKTEFDNILKSL